MPNHPRASISRQNLRTSSLAPTKGRKATHRTLTTSRTRSPKSASPLLLNGPSAARHPCLPKASSRTMFATVTTVHCLLGTTSTRSSHDAAAALHRDTSRATSSNSPAPMSGKCPFRNFIPTKASTTRTPPHSASSTWHTIPTNADPTTSTLRSMLTDICCSQTNDGAE